MSGGSASHEEAVTGRSAAVEAHELAWTPEKVARLWDFYGSSEAHRGAYFSALLGRRIVATADRLVGLRGRRVLDFGCGRGDLLAYLLEAGAVASGLEFSADSAELARGRLAGCAGFGGVELAQGLPSGLADGSFDVVLLVEVVEHLLDDQFAPTLAEVARLLVPGGSVVVTTPNAEDLAAARIFCPDCGAVFHPWQHQRSLSSQSIAALMAEHGFQAAGVRELDWASTRLGRLRARVGLATAGRPHLLYTGTVTAR